KKNNLTLTHAPIYAVLPVDSRPALIPPPEPPALLQSKTADVIMQAVVPETEEVVEKSAYTIPAGSAKRMPFFLYNFGNRNARGRLRARMPEGWKVSFP